MVINKRIRHLIYTSLLEVESRDIQRYDSFPKTGVEFSEEFNNKLRILINKNKKKNIAGVSKRKLIAIIVATALVISMAITAFAFRESILNFFVQIFDDHTHISSGEQESAKIHTYYAPTWLPEGYTSEMSNEGKTAQIKSWVSNGNRIKFTQTTIGKNGIYFDDNDGEYTTLSIASHDVYFSIQDSNQIFRWVYDGYSMKLECPDAIDLDTVEQIISSIEST